MTDQPSPDLAARLQTIVERIWHEAAESGGFHAAILDDCAHTFAALLPDLLAQQQEIERLSRHDCDQWAQDALGCSVCHAAYDGSLNATLDHLRARIDEQQQEIARLREERESFCNWHYHQLATRRREAEADLARLTQERDTLRAQIAKGKPEDDQARVDSQ